MQHKHLQFGHGFRIVLGDKHSQAAQMTLAPGESKGGPDNRHRGADQWLYVVSGSGEAIVNGTRVELREGTLVLIQPGDNPSSTTQLHGDRGDPVGTSRATLPRLPSYMLGAGA